jgi:hypothetical protein
VISGDGPDINRLSSTPSLAEVLRWTNQEATGMVNQTSGVTVNWSGGDPEGFVTIGGTGSATTAAGETVAATFNCTARAAAGTFAIPPHVLLSLPASSAALPGTLAVNGYSGASEITGEGLDFAVGIVSEVNARAVTYQKGGATKAPAGPSN